MIKSSGHWPGTPILLQKFLHRGLLSKQQLLFDNLNTWEQIHVGFTYLTSHVMSWCWLRLGEFKLNSLILVWFKWFLLRSKQSIFAGFLQTNIGSRAHGGDTQWWKWAMKWNIIQICRSSLSKWLICHKDADQIISITDGKLLLKTSW